MSPMLIIVRVGLGLTRSEDTTAVTSKQDDKLSTMRFASGQSSTTPLRVGVNVSSSRVKDRGLDSDSIGTDAYPMRDMDTSVEELKAVPV